MKASCASYSLKGSLLLSRANCGCGRLLVRSLDLLAKEKVYRQEEEGCQLLYVSILIRETVELVYVDK